MEKYTITTVKEGSYLRSDYKETISAEKNLLLGDIITDDLAKAFQTITLEEINNVLTEVSDLFPVHFRVNGSAEDPKGKIKFQDLNAPIALKLVTEIIQEIDHVKFSEKCEQILQENPETIQDYNIAPSIIKTQFGEAIMLMAMIQYWTTEEGYKAWKLRLMSKSKLGM